MQNLRCPVGGSGFWLCLSAYGPDSATSWRLQLLQHDIGGKWSLRYTVWMGVIFCDTERNGDIDRKFDGTKRNINPYRFPWNPPRDGSVGLSLKNRQKTQQQKTLQSQKRESLVQGPSIDPVNANSGNPRFLLSPPPPGRPSPLCLTLLFD